MTVSTEISSNEYTGNGVTTDFDYKFRIFKANQLSVITSDADGDNVVTLRLGTDYTVTGANKSAGGKVILTKPLANGHKISIARDIPITQETSFRNQSKFFAETHEDAFDYLTMILQRIWGSLGSLYLKRPNILANWFDAKGYRIANLGKPKRDSDAVDLGTLKDEIDDVNSAILKNGKRLLRVDDMDISAFPKVSERRNKQIGFDNEGIPTLLDPSETGALGYMPIDSFEKGAELTSRYQILFWEDKKLYYRWDGDLPKNVPAGSTPHTTGGVGVGRWLLVSRDVSGLVNVVDFGAIADCQKNDPASGTDSTQAFKRAISAARSTNSVLYVPPCRTGFGYRIEDTLFFGPKKLSDVIPFPPINVCLGLVGGGDESTFLIPGVGLKDKVMLDFTGLGHKYAKDFAIWSLDESIAPSVGILTARFSMGGNAVTGNHGGVFSDVQMFKYFSLAGRLAITTEESYELRLNIRNDHKDSFGCFVSTSDGSSEAYKDSASGVSHTWNNIIGEQPESELTRENVAGSNLHQVHVKCDYYYGNNTPNPDKNPCMLRIDGANSMVIRDPFFNNNSYEYDCVQIRRAGTAGIPYGITIENPIYHQNLKSGVRVMTGLNRLVMTQSNNLPGFSFSEAELVIDGFLSGSDIRGVRSVKQNEPVVDTTFDYISGVYSQSNYVTSCTLSKVSTYTQVTSSAISGSNLMCNTMNWNTNSSITNSKVTVNNTLNASGTRSGTPSFKLTYRGSEINISGQIPSSWLGSPSGISIDALVIAVGGNSTAHKLLGRSQSHSVQILEQENSSSTEAIQKKIAPAGTSKQFRYTEHVQGGIVVYEERKDGLHIHRISSGGPVLTSPNGSMYRVFVSDTGILSTALMP